ncbi:MAG: hypothetical protein M0D55_14125 [Elusimicrobiota bacterium]|nr:MAG: hypothetical protein M0D55_14125 [Elusimicrobiota bacterium]
MLITSAGFAALGAYQVAKSKGARVSDDGVDPNPHVSPEQARRNYVNSAVLIGAPILVAGLVYGGPIAWSAAAPAVSSALRGGQESLQRLAASEVGAVNPHGAVVWSYIRPTQPNWPGTEIPKSFEVSVRAGRLWVNPNATEHMFNFLGRVKSPESMVSRPPIQSQILLESFRSALEKAASQGIRYNQPMRIDSWELIIRPGGQTGPLPTVVHAQYYH